MKARQHNLDTVQKPLFGSGGPQLGKPAQRSSHRNRLEAHTWLPLSCSHAEGGQPCSHGGKRCKKTQEVKKKKNPEKTHTSHHFTFVSLSILFIYMMFLKNRKRTKRETQTYKVRAWYLEGPVARDQEWTGSWKQNNGALETDFPRPRPTPPHTALPTGRGAGCGIVGARVCAA